jgi:hypothetical protein
MKFEHSKFEAGVSKTMSALDKLKEKLKLKDAGKGFEDLQESANKVSFDKLSDSINGITELLQRRTGIIGGVFESIGQKIVSVVDNATSKIREMINSVTFEPIATGFKEYETKIDAIQVIAANTGVLTHEGETNMKDIEDGLDELNKYADKTIYNFTQMTQAIGTFTVAGVDLQDSITAVKGVANLAAFVGAGAADASRIMFQLGQGLNTGFINLQDWMSLEHSQGFSGKVFQDQLIDTAKHLREVREEYNFDVEALIEGAGSFRNSLKEGWLTTDVLMTTLHKFANDYTDEDWANLGFSDEEIESIRNLGKAAEDAATKSKTFTQMWDAVTEAAQSGWTDTWQTIVGGFEGASELWTRVGDGLGSFISSFSEARNVALDTWAAIGGREAFWSGIFRLFDNLREYVKAITDAFEQFFPSIDGEQLAKLTFEFRKLMRLFRDDAFPITFSLSNIFQTFFAILKAGVVTVKTIAGAIGNFVKSMFPENTQNVIAQVTWDIKEFVLALLDLEVLPDRIGSAITTLLNFIKDLCKGFIEATKFVNDYIKDTTGIDIADVFVKSFGKIKDVVHDFDLKNMMTEGWLKRLSLAAEALGDGASFLDKTKAVIHQIMEDLKPFFSEKADGISSFFSGEEIDKGDLIGKLGGLALIFLQIKMLVDALATGKAVRGASEGIGGFVKGLGEGLDSFKDAMDSIKNEQNIKLILSITAAIIALTVALVALSTLDEEKLSNACSVLVLMIGGLVSVIATLKKSITGLPNNTIMQLSVGLIAIWMAVINLIGAMALISLLDYESIAKGLLTVFLLMKIIMTAIKGLNHIRATSAIKATIAVSILVQNLILMIGALKLIDSLDLEHLGEDFLVLVGLFGMIALLSVTIAATANMAGKNMLAASVGLSVAIGAIWSMIAALIIIKASKISTTDDVFGVMWVVLGMIAGVILVMTALSSVFVTSTHQIANLLLLSLVVSVIFSVATSIIASLIALNTILDPEMTDDVYKQLLMISIAVAGVLAVLLILAARAKKVFRILGGFTLNTGAITVKIAPIAKILTGLSFLIISVVGSIYLLIRSFQLLMEISNEWDSGYETKMVNVLFGIADVIEAGKEAIKSSIVSLNDVIMEALLLLIDDLVVLIVNALYAVVQMADAIARATVDVCIALLNGLAGMDLTEAFDSNADGFWDQFVESGEKLVASDNSPLTKLIKALVNFIILVIYGVGDALVDSSGAVGQAILYFIASLLVVTLAVLSALAGTIAEFFWGPIFNSILGEDIDWSEYVEDFENNFKEGWSIFFEDLKAWFKENWDRLISDTLAVSFGSVLGGLPGAALAGGWFDKTFGYLFGSEYSDAKKEQTSLEEAQKQMNAAMQPYSDALDKSVEDMSKQGQGKFRSANGIESPSKVYEEDAKFIPQGAALGVDNASGDFTNSIQKMAEKAKGALKESFSGAGDSLSLDGEFSTQVTQVLDMNNVNSESLGIDKANLGIDQSILTNSQGFADLTNSLGNQTTEMAATNAYLDKQNATIDSENGSFYDDTNLLASLDNIRSDMAVMKSNLERMQVVLDTNALVGQLVIPMDRALGQRAFRIQTR